MRWKWILMIGTILIMALMVTVYVLLATYDYNKLKPQIARMVKDATGRELNLSGEINLDFGFAPALVVTDVTFANAPWGSQPEMIKIGKLRMHARLLPLLFKDVEVQHIGLEGVDVLLETDPGGRGNWDFIAADSSDKRARSFKPSQIEIDTIRIENLSLTYRDGKTGSASQLTLISFGATRQDTADMLAIDLRAEYNGQPVTLSGKTGLSRDLLAHQRFPLKLSGKFSNATVQIDGAIDDVLNLTGIDLKAQASGKNLAKFEFNENIRLPQTSAFDVSGHLKGSKEVLTLEDFRGNLSGRAVDLTISGRFGDLIALSGIDLQLTGSGKDLAEIGPIIGEKLPATDEFAVKGRLTGSAKALSLKEAQGSAKQGSLSVALSGEVKDLIAFSGLDLRLKGAGKDLAEIGPIIGEKLPKTGAFTLKGRLTGSAKALSLQKILGNIRRGNLKLNLQGGINNLLALSGMDLKLDGSGKDLSEVGPIIGKKLPATGEFTVKGRLTGSTKALALQDSQGRVGRGGLRLSLDGGIKNLIALTGIDIRFKGSGMDLAKLGPIIQKKLPKTDNFAVQGRLMGSMKALSLRDAEGRAGRDGMSIAFDGGITDVLALKSINIRLKASGKELAAIGPLVGSDLPKIGPFDVHGHLIGSAKFLLFKEFSAIVDKSDFKGLAKVEFRKRPKITVRLESSVIDFTPFLRMAEKDKQELGQEDKRQRRLFPEDPLPFDALKRVDADINLKARNIHVRDAQLEFGHLTLTLDDSNLSIDKLEATYKQTKISGNLHLDSSSPPQVATNFLVQNFDLGNLLKETGVSDQVRAVVDIAAHGKSRGDSVQRLMANLDGSVGAVMGKGFLTKYLDLLSMNLSQLVMPIWGSHKKAGEINCAVVQFDIKKGVATSKAFVFNTQIGVLSAEGDINLGTEQVKFLLDPKPKDFSFVNLSTKLRVTGTLLHPKVRPDTLSLATKGAKFLGHLALGPIGLLAPFVHLGAHKKHPCDVQSIGQLGLKVKD
jgi:uncharacterized protein involved in outer membrane biogenesis